MALPSFEQGPIRPPNEAYSLLVRVTRNCPWNRCTFCPVYKGERFSLRPLAEILADIDAMAQLCARIRPLLGSEGEITEALLAMLRREARDDAVQLVRFLADGGRSAFLQDANSIVAPVGQLEPLLGHLRGVFPSLVRVTTYARSHTLARRTLADLEKLRRAGLDRVHMGLESGSNTVLKRVEKGATAERHVAGGRRAKEAGFELSTYVMPGLGGRAHSEEHARETARVLRTIDPHFIRLRTLSVPEGSPLADERASGAFEELDDVELVAELRLLLSNLDGVHAVLVSDHALNLLEELEGQLPDVLPDLLGRIDRFLDLPDEERDLFIVGRRVGLLRRLADLDDAPKRLRAERVLAELRQRSAAPVPLLVRSLMARLV
jgi:hypothetical protein